MPSIITNRSKQLLVIPLNSGETLHLAPGEASDPVDDYQLNHNEKIEKLKSLNLITSEASQGAETNLAVPASGGVTPAAEGLMASPRTAAKRGRR